MNVSNKYRLMILRINETEKEKICYKPRKVSSYMPITYVRHLKRSLVCDHMCQGASLQPYVPLHCGYFRT